jgi:hypothetical protein
MVIDESNYQKGRNAMMHAAFFYYQLLEEGEFKCGQTSFWLHEHYTCWEMLDVTLNEPKNVSYGIDVHFYEKPQQYI